ncbi:C-C motif chemokine 20-like [Polyodon spathula]|uniref:C-C motif chemokine 20-like n=1 Tax=Polyodon spathula TaxID=7913 RepID=UPI001B7EF81E|nr:C-C motif chemokine 20-like [Polyodon spathula]
MERCNLLPVFLMLLLASLYVDHAAARDHSCCLAYSKKPLPSSRIKGYTIQTNKNSCNIEAVIFHTINDKHVCANPRDKWVLKRIQHLKVEVERMS